MAKILLMNITKTNKHLSPDLPKGSYTHTVLGLTFHGQSTDTTIDQQFMHVPLPKLQQSAFTEVSFTGLSSIHGCSGGP